MGRSFNEPKYNAAFDRCIDVMSRLIQKYGPAILDGQKATPDVTMPDPESSNDQPSHPTQTDTAA